MPLKNFSTLVVWKKSASLASQILRVAARYPVNEDTRMMCDMHSSALDAAVARAGGRLNRSVNSRGKA